MADIKKFLDQGGVSTLWSKVAEKVKAEETRAKAAEQANADAIAGIKNGSVMNDFASVEAKIATLQVAGDYAVNGHQHTKADITDFAHTHEMTEVNGLVDALANKGDKSVVDAHGTAISTLEGKVEALEAGTYDDSEVRDLIAANTKAIGDEVTRATGVEAGLDARLVEVETFFKTAEGESLDEALDTLVELQAYLNGEGAVADQMVLDIAANKKAIEDHAALDHDFASADTALKLDLEGQIALKADTSDVTTLGGKVTALEGKVDVDSVSGAIAAAIAAQNFEGYTTDAEHEALIGRVEVVEGKVATLEGASHTHTNKDLLDTYTQTEANLADAVAKKHAHANADVLDGITSTKVAAWDAAEANAKAYADGLAGNYDVAGAAAQALTDAKAYSDANLVVAKQYTDAEVAKIQALTTAEIEAAIAAVNVQ